MAECRFCNGEGKHKCTVCRGAKKVFKANYDDRCLMYPEYYHIDFVECPYCNGTGYMTCSNCNGTGEE